jgi:hypothetical protein
MRVAVRAVVLVAGLAVEVWAVRAGWSWVAAALDLLAGWSLLASAGWAMHVTGGCRALFGLSGTFWFLATPQVVGGWAGSDAALLGGAWLAPLATALLGAPGAWPRRRFPRAVAAASWVRAVPVLAAIGWLTAAVGGCLAAAALADSRRYAVRVPRAAAHHRTRHRERAAAASAYASLMAIDSGYSVECGWRGSHHLAAEEAGCQQIRPARPRCARPTRTATG